MHIAIKSWVEKLPGEWEWNYFFIQVSQNRITKVDTRFLIQKFICANLNVSFLRELRMFWDISQNPRYDAGKYTNIFKKKMSASVEKSLYF